MNNSIIVLLGLLVVLLPFGTSMNAMGIAESEYYTDEYMKYANDMVAHYEDESSYANDGYKSDQSSYENNNYDRKYPSYKQDSNSYGYDDKYKSKDRDSNSVSLSKINCENVNNNFNNVVIGNLNIGNSGEQEAGNSNGALNANTYGNAGERYNDGYQKDKDKDIQCIINNNNTIITGDGGNATDGNVTGTCEECFTLNLNAAQIEDVENLLSLQTNNAITTIEGLCDFLSNPDTTNDAKILLLGSVLILDVGVEIRQAIASCLIDLGLIEPVTPRSP